MNFLTDCPINAEIFLKNDAFTSRGAYSGLYNLSSEINGKPSYVESGRILAIWFYKDFWLIGKTSNIGSNSGAFYTKNEFGGLTDSRNKWYYLSFYDGWKEAGSNDVIIQCTRESK